MRLRLTAVGRNKNNNNKNKNDGAPWLRPNLTIGSPIKELVKLEIVYGTVVSYI